LRRRGARAVHRSWRHNRLWSVVRGRLGVCSQRLAFRRSGLQQSRFPA
jgi:hypothetical protein